MCCHNDLEVSRGRNLSPGELGLGRRATRLTRGAQLSGPPEVPGQVESIVTKEEHFIQGSSHG